MNGTAIKTMNFILSMRRLVVTVLASVCLTLIASSCTGLRSSGLSAKPTVSVKWRETFRTTENHSLPIGGLPGRTIGVAEQRGLAFFEPGDVATLGLWFTYETTGTNTSYRGYAQYSFKDGSTILALRERKGTVPGEQKGSLSFLQGTGRFLGIKGQATFNAVAVNPNAGGGDTYADAHGEYSLLQAVQQPP
jgi:hypothetical protein